jgi:VWFA-related protein
MTNSPCRLIAVLFCGLLAVATLRAQDQAPRFRSGVEITSIDATVVDDRGRPILGLGADDFTVRVDSVERRVVSAEWVSLTTPEGPKPPPPPEGYSSNEGATGGRLILLVIDQPNIRFGGAVGIRNAVNGFVDRLLPSDRVAVIGIGVGSPSIPFTGDRERIKRAIEQMPGQRNSLAGSLYNIAISEAMAIRRGDPGMIERVSIRECGDTRMARSRGEVIQIETCYTAVESEAHSMAMNTVNDGEQTLRALTALFGALRSINAPKTVVLVTEGFILDDAHPAVAEIGRLSAVSRASLFVLQLEDQAFDISRALAPTAPFEDRLETAKGIELLADAARGTLFRIVASADSLFERIESELSGYYLLGVESLPSDRSLRPPPVSVSVNRRGVRVRSRRQLANRAEEARVRTGREIVTAGITSPLPLSALPLRVATFALQDQASGAGTIQLLIHADVGLTYSTPKPVAVAFTLSDREGRIVESQMASARIAPLMNGVPSPLQFTGGASVPAGDYTLKIAVAESDLVGTLEHPVHATLLNAGAINFSELMVGGPTDAALPARPSVGHFISFGNVQGYVEAYGQGVRGLNVVYDVATTADGPALLNAEVPARMAGDERAIFNRLIPVRQLPPGKYVLRARIAGDTGLSKSPIIMTRGFEIAPPAVLLTSVETAPTSAPLSTALFLPVTDDLFARAFHRQEVSRPPVVQAFRQRVAPASLAAFDAGVKQLESGDFLKAELSFKAVIHPDADSSAPLAYLAAVFAASGHDVEAASAWQTALIEGADVPEIYQWLGDALMRTHEFAQARAVLEEAVGKWPSDLRFAKPLALLYATFGQGQQAVRTLERHLEGHLEDVDSLAMGVEWIYNLHSLGAVAHSRAEDLKLVRKYADAYERAHGPQVALVKQWVDFIGRPTR